jgi:hypothetical protein
MIILILYWLSFRWFPLFWHRWLFWVALVLADGFLVALMSGFPLRFGRNLCRDGSDDLSIDQMDVQRVQVVGEKRPERYTSYVNSFTLPFFASKTLTVPVAHH